MNKKILRIVLIVLLLFGIGFGAYYYFTNEDKSTSFTKVEKDWIQNNKLKLIDIGVENDIPVLNYVGEGVVFDFFKDFEATTELEFNRISYSYNEKNDNEYSFQIAKNVASNQIKIYEDNYVLLTTESKKINGLNEIKNLKIGVLASDLSEIKSYLSDLKNEFVSFANITELENAIGLNQNDVTVDAILVPKLLALKYALNEKIYVAYLINDIKTNYVIKLGSNDRLNTIIKKYYTKWSEENFEDEFNKYFTKYYFEFKGTDQNSIASFKGKRYIYGYIEDAPYDITINSDLYGTNKAILNHFAALADIEIVYKKYENIDALLNAFENNNVDLFFNNTKKSGYDLNGFISSNAYTNSLVVITKNNTVENISSLKSLKDKIVASLRGSVISSLLSKEGVKVKEYKTVENLVDSKENIMVLDYLTYDYYKKSDLSNYKIDSVIKNDNYGYTMKSVTANSIFNEYLDFFLKVMPQNKEISSGMNEIITKNNNKTLFKSVALISGLVIVYIASILLTSQMNKTKQPSISFKKTEKIKYMDMLTSLKNRNYLNDNMDLWEESQVYPQAIIIIDLNNIAYINDNYGHNAGDEEIKEAANVLIKNQIINSDIVRTNGNEFLIYLVGYKDRQIELYIKKLNKELKELKHGFGAAIGYSMITDDIKTIDDAINEATIAMRKVKEETNDNKDSE